MIKIIEDNNIVYARVIRASYPFSSSEFFTDVDDEIQFGVLNYKKDYKTGTHFHNHINQYQNKTDEIIFMQEGSARIDFFDDKGVYLKSIKACKGDIVIICQGGHNITYLEDSKIYIVKTGAYSKKDDVVRIVGANNLELNIED